MQAELEDLVALTSLISYGQVILLLTILFVESVVVLQKRMGKESGWMRLTLIDMTLVGLYLPHWRAPL